MICSNQIVQGRPNKRIGLCEPRNLQIRREKDAELLPRCRRKSMGAWLAVLGFVCEFIVQIVLPLAVAVDIIWLFATFFRSQ